MAARADSVVLLPPAGDAALVAERADAQAALALALEGQGVRVLRHDAVAHDEDACAQVDCAPALLRDAGVDLAAAVAVWGEPHAGAVRATQVFVTLVDARGNRFPGAARVAGADVAAATRTAFLDARALQLLGPGPWIRVRGTPEGADVRIDGHLVGALPYRGRIDAGRHQLEVSSWDMRPHTTTVDVPPTTARVVEVEVALAPGGASSPPACGGSAREAGEGGACVDLGAASPTDDSAESRDDADSTSASHPIAGPLILGGVGLALAGVAVAQAMSGDCLRREPTGTCTREREPNTPMTVTLAGAAGAAIAGAVLWYVLGAEEAAADASAENTAGLHPLVTGVAGRF